jgi:hypothetical protein
MEDFGIKSRVQRYLFDGKQCLHCNTFITFRNGNISSKIELVIYDVESSKSNIDLFLKEQIRTLKIWDNVMGIEFVNNGIIIYINGSCNITITGEKILADIKNELKKIQNMK